MENTFAVLSSKDIWETIRHYTKPIYAYQYSGEFRSFTNSIYYDERIVILFYDGDKKCHFLFFVSMGDRRTRFVHNYEIYKIQNAYTYTPILELVVQCLENQNDQKYKKDILFWWKNIFFYILL